MLPKFFALYNYSEIKAVYTFQNVVRVNIKISTADIFTTLGVKFKIEISYTSSKSKITKSCNFFFCIEIRRSEVCFKSLKMKELDSL